MDYFFDVEMSRIITIEGDWTLLCYSVHKLIIGNGSIVFLCRGGALYFVFGFSKTVKHKFCFIGKENGAM